MIKMQIFGFILRWLASSIGMYFCITWFAEVKPDPATTENIWIFYGIAGLIFSIFNSIIKPIIKIFALPLAILTMGLSTLVINVIIVAITIHLLPGVEMSFWPAVLSSLVMSIINAILNFLIT